VVARFRAPAVIAALLASLALLAAGCGDDDDSGEGGSEPDGAALGEAFGEASEEAYASVDQNRDEDFARGALLEGCFILDSDGVAAVGEQVAGVPDATLTDPNFLYGPPGEEETLSCGIEAGEGTLVANVTAGTTLVDRDGFLERITRDPEAPTTEIEGEAPGLDPANVVAVEVGESAAQLVWISDGFAIGVSGPAEELGGDAGFEALSVAVEEVSRTLGG
jgi:hypothetical protein